MPPEFAQQLQQLFARQMAVAYLHQCARLDVPLNLVSGRLEELDQGGEGQAGAALRAEFVVGSAGAADPEAEG